MTEIVRPEDMQYVLVTHLWKIEPKLGEKADVYFGILSEDETKVKFCVLKGWRYAEGLQYGSLGEMPKKNVADQIEQGITEKLDLQYYLDEFHGIEE